jgi:hypothetical protein
MVFVPIGIAEGKCAQRPRNKVEKLIVGYMHAEITKNVKSRDEYNSTIALAHQFLGQRVLNGDERWCAGIAYPSVESIRIASSTMYNVAMTPEDFDAHYSIKESCVYCLTFENTHYELNRLNRGSVGIDGKVSWQYTYDEMKERVSRGQLADGKIYSGVAGLGGVCWPQA